MTNQLASIDFHGQTLLATIQDNVVYTALKPICENIGLDWDAQRQRINRDEVLNSTTVIITAVGNDGKNREMLCLPIQYLNGWLFGVDTNRVKAEIKDKLITYKKECYQALFDYWTKGVAVSPNQLPTINIVNPPIPHGGELYKTFIATVNMQGTMTMREMDKDEFVSSHNDLPDLLRYRSWHVSDKQMAKIAKAALNKITHEWE
ncbi:putative antirepressor protein [Moraxella macacae 0408225]|uniref:Putative antirepressor protein n=1 Tax=Moraxella macacae 0408225 TaxID=1230338 RepID=L2F6Q9_9GAMM|nr:phage antirepressor N-terminal domain-containing protein [Moraxella macacae]ELA08727.1 putative antirepressor protein [Moraxella macacae 0408225]